MTTENYTSFRDWMTNQFTYNELADIANHGCVCGFHGLVYYSETTALYQKYKNDIWEKLYEYAQALGYSILGLINSFGRANDIEDVDQFENQLVWAAAEQIADEITQGQYKEEK